MLRAKVFTFGDLDSLSVWFSFMVEKEGDLQGVTRERKQVVG